MTCRERLKIDHPDYVSDIFIGGCKDCPDSFYNISKPNIQKNGLCAISCTECWDRNLLETESTKPTEPKEDVVNHPNHYTNGGMECIEEMILVFGKETVAHFCLCNAWKYRYRALYKNGEEDIKKSHWYMNKYKELMSEWD